MTPLLVLKGFIIRKKNTIFLRDTACNREREKQRHLAHSIITQDPVHPAKGASHEINKSNNFTGVLSLNLCRKSVLVTEIL